MASEILVGLSDRDQGGPERSLPALGHDNLPRVGEKGRQRTDEGELESTRPGARFDESPLIGLDLVGDGGKRLSLAGQALLILNSCSESNADELMSHFAGHQSGDGAGIKTIA